HGHHAGHPMLLKPMDQRDAYGLVKQIERIGNRSQPCKRRDTEEAQLTLDKKGEDRAAHHGHQQQYGLLGNADRAQAQPDQPQVQAALAGLVMQAEEQDAQGEEWNMPQDQKLAHRIGEM